MEGSSEQYFVDILAKIFKWDPSMHFGFACLCKDTSEFRIFGKEFYDRIDVMLAIGIRVEISQDRIVWYKNGKRHREGDLPAVEHSSGTKEWYKKGRKHRDNGKPAVKHSGGSKEWFLDGNVVGMDINPESGLYYHRGSGLSRSGFPPCSKEYLVDTDGYFEEYKYYNFDK